MISTAVEAPATTRNVAIDALRGLTILVMIFVNNLPSGPDSVMPAWMLHHDAETNGMTFVDLVFPAFIFVMGMSVPLALDKRLNAGDSVRQVLWHVVSRAGALIVVGIMMCNDSPDPSRMPLSEAWYWVLLYLAAISFCANVRVLRIAGFAGLLVLAFVYTSEEGLHVINLNPFSLEYSWYGILGLIGWAYLISSLVYLVFRRNRTALLASAVLLLCVYELDSIGIAQHLASLSSIAVLAVFLSTDLRPQPALLFIGGCAAAALLVAGIHGISKVNATPAWCLWAAAITAAFWLLLHFFPARLLAMAGGNVLLAYLLSEVFGYFLEVIGIGSWYDALNDTSVVLALIRAVVTAVLIVAAAIGLNRVGFRLRV
ncbi:DUF5009 domain-containing protein [Amycolatopsis sp. cg5]|uniref:DUF5009 domain-containing protein n=1 Tax=Amycolatopsis sp. cg5 TaxID=3238802 RepID=UPI003524933D